MGGVNCVLFHLSQYFLHELVTHRNNNEYLSNCDYRHVSLICSASKPWQDASYTYHHRLHNFNIFNIYRLNTPFKHIKKRYPCLGLDLFHSTHTKWNLRARLQPHHRHPLLQSRPGSEENDDKQN